jgi:hypothetical protein
MMQSSTGLTPHTVVTVICIPVLTFGAILTIPAFVGVLGKHYGLPHAALGRLASVEYLVCITGTYLTNNRSIDQLTRWVPWACALAAITNLAGFFFAAQAPLILFHPFAAFGAGVSYGYVLKVINASGRQERYFGAFMALFNLTMLGEFQVIAYLTARYTGAAIFIIYAVLALGALMVSLVTRSSVKKGTSIQTPVAKKQGRPGMTIVISIIAMAVSYTAYGIIWPYAQLVGVARGFSVTHVANGLSIYAITAIVGALSAAAIPWRMSRALILSLALCAVLSSIYMMYLAASYVLFFLGCAVFGFYWNFYLTLHLGVIARSDGTGRGIVLCGVAPSVGAIIGSFLGGTLVRGVDYQLLAWMGGMLCIIGVACAVATITRMKPVNAVPAMPS